MAGLRGKKIVVIGGTSGIGFAIAEAALAEQAQIVIASSNPKNVEAAVKRLGKGAAGAAVNVTDEAAIARFFEQLGPFDHLAYTAGDWGPLRLGGALAALDLKAIGGVFDVRFWGALAIVKHGHATIARDGSFTLTNGMVAHRPRKGAPVSVAMAGAIEHLVQGLAIDLAPVRVNCVCPGLIRTDVWNSIPAEQREERLKAMTARQPLPRAGDPGEAAEAYLYLMRGGYTTGQILRVEGGSSLV